MRTVLYWDRFGLVVPESFESKLRHESPYTSKLIDHQLVQLVNPEMLTELLVPDFFSTFMALVRQTPPESLEGGPVRVHVDKVKYFIGNELVKMQKAAYGEDPSWFIMPRGLADLYMAYVTTTLAYGTPLRMTPITDDPRALGVFLGADIGDKAAANRDNLRSILLEAILPSPADNTPVEKLARFKDDHRDDLARFRNRIELIAAEVANFPAAQQHEVLQRRVSLATDEVHELVVRMGRRGIKVDKGTPLATAGTTIVAVIASVLAGSALPALGAIPSLVLAAYQACRRPPDRDFAGLPFAYAAFAGARLRTA